MQGPVVEKSVTTLTPEYQIYSLSLTAKEGFQTSGIVGFLSGTQV